MLEAGTKLSAVYLRDRPDEEINDRFDFGPKEITVFAVNGQMAEVLWAKVINKDGSVTCWNLAQVVGVTVAGKDGPPKTEVVCLCGSTRFMDAFHAANARLSLEGKIVLTVEIVTYDGATDPQRADPEQKVKLDELHLRKIDLADRVFVLNVGGYIGESTRDEINYAESIGKPIEYLEIGKDGQDETTDNS